MIRTRQYYLPTHAGMEMIRNITSIFPFAEITTCPCLTHYAWNGYQAKSTFPTSLRLSHFKLTLICVIRSTRIEQCVAPLLPLSQFLIQKHSVTSRTTFFGMYYEWVEGINYTCYAVENWANCVNDPLKLITAFLIALKMHTMWHSDMIMKIHQIIWTGLFYDFTENMLSSFQVIANSSLDKLIEILFLADKNLV